MTIGAILLILLAISFLVAIPTWSYSREWGYMPSGLIGILLVIILILLFVGYLPLTQPTVIAPVNDGTTSTTDGTINSDGTINNYNNGQPDQSITVPDTINNNETMGVPQPTTNNGDRTSSSVPMYNTNTGTTGTGTTSPTYNTNTGTTSTGTTPTYNTNSGTTGNGTASGDNKTSPSPTYNSNSGTTGTGTTSPSYNPDSGTKTGTSSDTISPQMPKPVPTPVPTR